MVITEVLLTPSIGDDHYDRPGPRDVMAEQVVKDRLKAGTTAAPALPFN